jgi:hypothetical protein
LNLKVDTLKWGRACDLLHSQIKTGVWGKLFVSSLQKDQRLYFEKAVCVFEYAMWWFIEGCREAEATKAKCKEFMEKPAPADF